MKKLALRGMRIEKKENKYLKSSYVYHGCGISHKSGLISSFSSSNHGNTSSASLIGVHAGGLRKKKHTPPSKHSTVENPTSRAQGSRTTTHTHTHSPHFLRIGIDRAMASLLSVTFFLDSAFCADKKMSNRNVSRTATRLL